MSPSTLMRTLGPTGPSWVQGWVPSKDGGALIVPAPRANGSAVAEALNRWRDRLGIDDEFVARVATAGDVPVVVDGDPWRE